MAERQWDKHMEKVWTAMEDAYLAGWTIHDLRRHIEGSYRELVKRHGKWVNEKAKISLKEPSHEEK